MENHEMERFMEVLWSIHARLEEIEEVVKKASLTELEKAQIRVDEHFAERAKVVNECERRADGWFAPKAPHVHEWLECGEVGWNRNLVLCECGDKQQWYDGVPDEVHDGQFNDGWGGCPACSDQHSRKCDGCK